MRPFRFALMLLLQRADDRLRLERRKHRPDERRLDALRQAKRRLFARLERSLAGSPAAGG